MGAGASGDTETGIPAQARQVRERPRNHGLDGLVPPRFVGAAVSDFPVGVAAQLAQGSPERSSVLLVGPVGVGKTHLAAGILAEWLDAEVDKDNGLNSLSVIKRRFAFVTVPELLGEMRAAMNVDGDSPQEVLDDYADRPGGLVVDDLGAARDSAWVEESLFVLVDRRYSRQLRTVYTSNHDLEELAGKVGDRIASRLNGSCVILRLEGDDRRLPQGPGR